MVWLALAFVLAAAPDAGPGCALPDGEATLQGTARDAKAGAVVVLADGEPIYLAGLDAWPKAVRDHRVQVRGTLACEKRIPDPGSRPLTQGAFGKQLVLHRPHWKRLR